MESWKRTPDSSGETPLSGRRLARSKQPRFEIIDSTINYLLPRLYVRAAMHQNETGDFTFYPSPLLRFGVSERDKGHSHRANKVYRRIKELIKDGRAALICCQNAYEFCDMADWSKFSFLGILSEKIWHARGNLCALVVVQVSLVFVFRVRQCF